MLFNLNLERVQYLRPPISILAPYRQVQGGYISSLPMPPEPRRDREIFVWQDVPAAVRTTLHAGIAKSGLQYHLFLLLRVARSWCLF